MRRPLFVRALALLAVLLLRPSQGSKEGLIIGEPPLDPSTAPGFKIPGPVIPPEQYKKAKILSCATCKLQKKPEVKRFIFEDFDSYENTDFLKIPGKDPKIYFYSNLGQVIEEYTIVDRSRTELLQMMEERGFKLKQAPRYSEL